MPRNRIKCVLCGDTIESKHRHDFKWCSCHSVAVDGGRDYQRLIGEPKHIIVLDDAGNGKLLSEELKANPQPQTPST